MITPAQQELYDAMKRGVRVFEMRGMDTYFFRADTHARCTRQALALLKHKMVVKFLEDWRGCQLKIKES